MHCTPLEKLKARKLHRCMSCGEVIAAGGTYYRWRCYIDGDAGTNKMHPECYEMHDADGGEWDYSPYNYERPQTVPNDQGNSTAPLLAQSDGAKRNES